MKEIIVFIGICLYFYILFGFIFILIETYRGYKNFNLDLIVKNIKENNKKGNIFFGNKK